MARKFVKMYVMVIASSIFALVGAKESFNTTPPPISSDFSCAGRPMGFYADVETNCRAYHMCDDHGNHFTHYCPEDTAFRQDAMICDHAYLVDCQANVKSAPVSPRLGQDANHDAPPSSFIEPRGEGTNTRGYARSFRINPDSKSSTASKYPTFVLNSSVFLTSREPTENRQNLPARNREPENSSKTRVTQKDYKTDTTPIFRLQENKNSLPTTPRITISENLQPPLESSRKSKVINNYSEDQFTFLLPPPLRNDNNYFQKNSFKPLKADNIHAQKSSSESFKTDNSDSFQGGSHESVTFSPRTKMILEMVKARGMDTKSDPIIHVSKPANFLEPPLFKSDSSLFSRSNFNFHNDDYPYVETLRSIQNNKPATSIATAFNSPTTTKFASTTTPATTNSHPTEASIFAVPTKTLLPGGDVEHDPYYPKPPTTTEAYYTPRHQVGNSRKPYFTTTRKPFTSSVKFEIPEVLPDLNSLEDLLDRRKFFFIPQVKSV